MFSTSFLLRPLAVLILLAASGAWASRGDNATRALVTSDQTPSEQNQTLEQWPDQKRTMFCIDRRSGTASTGFGNADLVLVCFDGESNSRRDGPARQPHGARELLQAVYRKAALQE